MPPSSSATSEYHFGPCLRLRETGVFTRETWRDRWTDVLARVFWPRPVYTVTEIDVERGIITLT